VGVECYAHEATELHSSRQAGSRAASTTKFPSLGSGLSICLEACYIVVSGGCFEIYNLALTATLSPGLIRSGIFHEDSRGALGLTDQASFAAATFADFFVGTAVLGAFADKFGPPHDL